MSFDMTEMDNFWPAIKPEERKEVEQKCVHRTCCSRLFDDE